MDFSADAARQVSVVRLRLVVSMADLPEISSGSWLRYAGKTGGSTMSYRLSAMPDGYNLQTYDDCGAPDRQPHIVQTSSQTFLPEEVNADERVRTVVWDWIQVDARYSGLRPDLDYVLAVTYANDVRNDRVQSIWAGETGIQAAYVLPRGGAERLIFPIPREAIRNGKLSLQFRREAGVNVVVSLVELWAEAPSPGLLRLCDVSGRSSDLTGSVLDLWCEPIAMVKVVMLSPSGTKLMSALTDKYGRFRFSRSKLNELRATGEVELVASSGNLWAARRLAADELDIEQS